MNDVQRAINSISGFDTLANGMESNFADVSVVKLYATELRGLSKEQALLALSTKNLSTEQKNQILTELGLIASEDKIQKEALESAFAKNKVNEETRQSILENLGLIAAEGFEAEAQENCTKADLEAILAQNGIVGAQKEGILSSLGLGGANLTLAESFEMIKLQASKAWAALLANPLTPVIAGIAALAAGVFVAVKAYDHFTVTLDEAKEAANEAISSYQEITSEVEGLESQIKSLNEQIDSLDPITDADEISRLQRESAELERQVDILKEKQRLAGIKADDAAQQSLNTKTTSKYAPTEMSVYDPSTGMQASVVTFDQVTQEQELRRAMEAYNDYATEWNEAQETMRSLSVQSLTHTQEYKDAEKQAEDYNRSKEFEKLEKLKNGENYHYYPKDKSDFYGIKKYYVMEKSKILLNNLDADTICLGTDFNHQTLKVAF